ncbi:SGNH/GDSL hydrolase family protein [Membranicola marinus]|uniref:SGNH/GDSL hydrolase family protein n=1 Tax=Membranihabitans marinus TaxID=1227546 RepID=A0A953HRA4_9BACT|nr:SGNH/GDSL hydrolase family protein [Membranihabitans marinus]MBY5956945.1 SGNH/GDSL hydrolase family protein [Membranihabitans marinus]
MHSNRRDFLKKTGTYISVGTMTSLAGLNPDFAVHRTIQTSKGKDLEKIKALLERKKPNIWLFTGDSITHGAKHTHGYRSYPEVFQERIRWEIGRVRDVIINTGISGNAASNILSDFEWRIQQFNPHVVSIMIGTNDCAREGMSPDQFKKNVERLINRIRDIGAIPVLHTPNVIILDKSPKRKTLPNYIPALRSLAEEVDIVLIDNYQHWEEAMQRDSEKIVFKNWLNDPLHPNQFGHQEIARVMFRKFGIFDPSAATCGGEYYEGEH